MRAGISEASAYRSISTWRRRQFHSVRHVTMLHSTQSTGLTEACITQFQLRNPWTERVGIGGNQLATNASCGLRCSQVCRVCPQSSALNVMWQAFAGGSVISLIESFDNPRSQLDSRDSGFDIFEDDFAVPTVAVQPKPTQVCKMSTRYILYLFGTKLIISVGRSGLR